MLKKLLSLIKPLVGGKDDKFLVLEIFSAEGGPASGGENHILNKAVSIRANFQNKELKVAKVRAHADLKKLLKKFSRFGRLGNYKIIVGLDSHLASTIYSSVVLVRDKYKELIDEPELDNLISQAIWKFFDRSRNKVAGKIGVADMDILLSDVRIRGIKLDGHKVVNPLGFKAKTVEVQFSQTFLSRSLVDSIKESLPLQQVVFMSENGAACSSVVARAQPVNESFLFANLYHDRTQLFLADGSQNSYWDRLGWGENNLKRSLAEDLALDAETAGLVIAKYSRKEASETFRRRFEGLLGKELDSLASSLNASSKKAGTRTIYFNPFFDMPEIFAASMKSQFDRTVKFQKLSLDLISQNFGFDIKFKHKGDAEQSFCTIAALMEWYLSPHDDKMSQLAKRRVRWLSPV